MRLFSKRSWADDCGAGVDVLAEAMRVTLAEVLGPVRIEMTGDFDGFVAHTTDRVAFDKARSLVFDRFGVPYEWLDDDEYHARMAKASA